LVDDEGRKDGLWRDVEKAGILLRWPNKACTERAVFGALPDALLLQIVDWAEIVTGREARHGVADIRKALEIGNKTLSLSAIFDEVGRAKFESAAFESACPRPKSGAKPRGWFKTFGGGHLLADKLFHVTPRPEIMKQIDAFIDRIVERTAT
jgi:hypothetical protein